MANIFLTVFTFILIIICLFLVFVVLLQRANTNAGLGTAFGGGMAESTFGAETGNILTKSTIGASVAFFVISFGLYLGYIAKTGDSNDEGESLPNISSQPVPVDLEGDGFDPLLSDTVLESIPEETEAENGPGIEGDSDIPSEGVE